MKRLGVSFSLVVVLAAQGAADEGMWRPGQLPAIEGRLTELGLEIDTAGLTGLTEHPMNAVISLGGCTASFVSPEGLVVTNYHCVKGALQYNSSEEHNLLRDGFLAQSRAEELPAGPGSRVLVTVEVTDVTEDVVADLPEGLSGAARFRALDMRRKSSLRSARRTTAIAATCAATTEGTSTS